MPISMRHCSLFQRFYAVKRAEGFHILKFFFIFAKVNLKDNAMNIQEGRKRIAMLRGYIEDFTNLFTKMLDLDYHYAVIRRDYGNRFVLTEFVQKSLSILVVSLNRFIKDVGTLSASALTFYSILAFIPLVALVFAIAKGFGAGEALQSEVLNQFHNNPEIAAYIVEFANKALANTKGGLVTGIGIVVLLWAVIKMLHSTELAMNRIWGVRKGRSLRRMFTDYLSILFIAPILIVLVSSLNVYLSSNLETYFPVAGSIILKTLKLLPYVLVWVLFIFLYMFMPSVPVKFKHALIAGIIAGTVYQIVQWIYIRFQVGVSSYNAIYGGLAALPLMLVWLQLSWSVVLWGTELCYIFRNRHFMYKSELLGDASWMETTEWAVKIVRYVARVYVTQGGGPSLGMLNKELKMNTGKLRLVLQELVDRHILVEAKEDEDYFYYPATDFHALSVGDVIINLSRVEESSDEQWKRAFMDTIRAGYANDKLI